LKYARELIVWRVGDPGTPGAATLDPEILDWCETHQFILVTNNRHSMPVHLKDHLDQGRHIPGILILNPNMTVGETIDELVFVWEVSEINEFADRIEFLPVP
jgi:hypothetical protein